MAWNNHYHQPPPGGGPQYGSAPYQTPGNYQFGQSSPQQSQTYQRHPQYGYPNQQSQPGFQPQPYYSQSQHPYQYPSGPNSGPPNQPRNMAYPPNNFGPGGYNQPPYGGAPYPSPNPYQQAQMPPPMQPPMHQPSYGQQPHPASYRSHSGPHPKPYGRFNPYQRRKTYPSFGPNSGTPGLQQGSATAPNTSGNWSGHVGPQSGYQQGYQGNYQGGAFQGPFPSYPPFQQSPSATPPQGPGFSDFNSNLKGWSASAGQTSFANARESSDFSGPIVPDRSVGKEESEPQNEEPVNREIGDTGKTFPDLYQPPARVILGHIEPEIRTWSLVVEQVDGTCYWRVWSKKPPRIFPRVDEEVPIHPGGLGLHQWDNFDFDGPMFAKSDEYVDPTWSIGVTVWHPPKQMTRAIHWDWKEAYMQVSKPLPAPLKYEDSVSEYFQDSKNLAMVDVRDSRDWESLKDDIDFQPFVMNDDWTSTDAVRANRSRVDREEEEENAAAAQEERLARLNRPQSPNIMDNLDNILAGSQEGLENNDVIKYQNGGQLLSPMEDDIVADDYPPNLKRDEEQEKVLAALGVTGSPKPPRLEESYDPWQIDTQAIQPLTTTQHQASPDVREEVPGRRYSEDKHAWQATLERRYSHEGRHSGNANRPHSQPPPPSPPPPESPERDTCVQSKTCSQVKDSPTGSHGSPRTTAASDIHVDDDHSQASPTPQLRRASSGYAKKRGYDAIVIHQEDSDGGERKRQAEDDSLRHRKRGRPTVPAAYGRR